MDNIRVEQKTSEWSKTRRRKKLWQRVLAGMMAVVVFSTTYALILPAITREQETFCGHEEHVHGEECYVAQTQLLCTLPEEETHTHTEDCYSEQPVLLCGLEETEAHVHGEGCCAEQSVYVCGLEESEGHSHTDACYARTLISEETDPAHEHTDACYEWERRLVCEEGHEHTDACYARVLACELEESEGHVHSDACLGTEQVLVCELAESEGHAHSEACQGTQRVLVCELPEGEQPHEHTEDCYLTTLELVCERQEHAHTLQCFSDPNADRENEKVWARSVSSVKLSGDWRQDVLAVAQTQLGQGESEKNYQVDEQGAKQGYTRYADWWGGSAYDPWCATFVSFVLNYAGVDRDVVPFDSGTLHWVDSLKTAGLWRAAADYAPQPGDLIFFDFDDDLHADHVGLVYELNTDEYGALTELTTIEGNNSAKVETFSYKPGYLRILGYGALPENPHPDVTITPAARGWSEQQRRSPEAEDGTLTLRAVADGVLVTLTAAEEDLPYPVEELTLSVTPVEDEAAKALVEAAAEEAAEARTENEAAPVEDAVRKTLLFDIKILHGDEEVQPLGPVVVTFADIEGLEEATDDAQVYYVDPAAETVEEVTAEAAQEGKVAMEAEHFSVYGVTWTLTYYKDDAFTYYVPANSEIRLSELLAALNINRSASEVQRVSSSNGIVTVSRLQQEGDWLLTGTDATVIVDAMPVNSAVIVVSWSDIFAETQDSIKITVVRGEPNQPASGSYFYAIDMYYAQPGMAQSSLSIGALLPHHYDGLDNLRYSYFPSSEGVHFEADGRVSGNAPGRAYDDTEHSYQMTYIEVIDKNTGHKVTQIDYSQLFVESAHYHRHYEYAAAQDQVLEDICIPAQAYTVFEVTPQHQAEIAAYKASNSGCDLVYEVHVQRKHTWFGPNSQVVYSFRERDPLPDLSSTPLHTGLPQRDNDNPDWTNGLGGNLSDKRWWDVPNTNATTTLPGYLIPGEHYVEARVRYNDWEAEWDKKWPYYDDSEWRKGQIRTDDEGWITIVTPLGNSTTPGGTVTLHKVDENGDGLTGAVFTLSGTGANGNGFVIDSVPGSQDGWYVFRNVPPGGKGDYTITESTTPAGYRTMQSLTFPASSVTANGTYTYPDIVVNYPDAPPSPGEGDVEIVKVDYQGNPVTNAGFTLSGTSSIDGRSFSIPADHLGNGVYRFVGVPVGLQTDIYTIEETLVPPGYERIDNIEFSGALVTDGQVYVYRAAASPALGSTAPGSSGGNGSSPSGSSGSQPLQWDTSLEWRWALWINSPDWRMATDAEVQAWRAYYGWGESLPSWGSSSGVSGGSRIYHHLYVRDTTPSDDDPGGPVPNPNGEVVNYPVGYKPPAPTPTPPPVPTNPSECLIIIHKYDKAGNPLPGATFEVRQDAIGNSGASLPLTDVGDGTYWIIVDHSWFRYYWQSAVVEVQSPPGYDLCDAWTARAVDIYGRETLWARDREAAGELYFGNNEAAVQQLVEFFVYDPELKPSALEFEKVDKDTRTPLTDAVFELTGYSSIDGSRFTIRSTEVPGSPGTYRFDGVVPGRATDVYTVREITPPPGYAVAPDFTVTGDKFYGYQGGTYTLEAPLNPVLDEFRKGVMQFRKIDGMTGLPLSGATFTIEGDSTITGTPVHFGPITADEVLDASGNGTGLYEFTNVPEGRDSDLYTVTETHTPDDTKYKPVAPFTVQGSLFAPANGTYFHQTTLVDEGHTGTLRLRKVDGEGNPLSGAQFTMTGLSSIYGDFTRRSIHLYDETGNDADKGVYEIRNVPKDEDGNLYTVHEVTPPAGYARVSDFTVQWAKFQDDGSGRLVYDYSDEHGAIVDPKTGTLRLKKVNAANEPLTGAQFRMIGNSLYYGGFSRDSVDLYRLSVLAGNADDNLKGLYEIRDVPVGALNDVYTVYETQAPAAYAAVDPFTVGGVRFANGLVEYDVDLVDPAAKGTLRFYKVNKVSLEPITGLRFTLSGKSNITGTEIAFGPLPSNEVDPVNEPGWYEITGIPAGLDSDVYEVTEDPNFLPRGYEAVSFTVRGHRFNGNNVVYTYPDSVKDPPVAGTLKFSKEDQGGNPLPGAVFTMTGTSSVHGGFSLRSVDLYEESYDPTTGNYDVSKKGLYEIRGVPYDEADSNGVWAIYTVRETAPPAGYAAAPDFSVTWEDFDPMPGHIYTYRSPSNTVTGALVDVFRPGVMQFRKISGSTGQPIIGAKFEMSYNGTDQALMDTFANNPPVFREVDPVGSPGLYEFTNVPQGTANDVYTITEVAPLPQGYQAVSFTVTGDHFDPALGTYTYRDPNTGGPIEDPPITGTLRLTKVGNDPGNPLLTGAVFVLAGTSVEHGKFELWSVDLYQESVDEGKPDVALKGLYEIRGIPSTSGNQSADADKYVLVELQAPSGYEPRGIIRRLSWSEFASNTGNILDIGDVVNQRSAYALTVTKKVVDASGNNNNASFPFIVTITDGSGNRYLLPSNKLFMYDGDDPIQSNAVVESGTGNIAAFLYDGWKLVVKDIPSGYSVTVTESWHTGYDVKINDVDDPDASISVTINQQDQTVRFENTRQFTSVRVTKSVKGGDPTAIFPFPFRVQIPAADAVRLNTITLYDASGTEITDAARTAALRVESASGLVEFALMDDEYVEFGEVPVGTLVNITETKPGKYVVTIKDVTSGPTTTGNTALIRANGTPTKPAEILVINSESNALPHTGGLGTFLTTLGGTILTGSALVYGLKRRRRERRFNT